MPRSSITTAASQWPRTASISRSLTIYYRDKARTVRMDQLHAGIIAPGGLVFDIGAHVGDRTSSFLRCGASVVALEPQPHVFRALRLIHGRAPRTVLLPMAAGANEGKITLHLNLRNPTVASVEPAFIAAAAGAPGWEGEVWDDRVTVLVTTLDALIARYGLPDFVKIDVEGHEAAVLDGLSHALQALSFEFTTIQRHVAHACIARISALGAYEYNYSLGEEHTLREGRWMSPEEMRRVLDALPDTANSGDVYARRISPADRGPRSNGWSRDPGYGHARCRSRIGGVLHDKAQGSRCLGLPCLTQVLRCRSSV